MTLDFRPPELRDGIVCGTRLQPAALTNEHTPPALSGVNACEILNSPRHSGKLKEHQLLPVLEPSVPLNKTVCVKETSVCTVIRRQQLLSIFDTDSFGGSLSSHPKV